MYIDNYNRLNDELKKIDELLKEVESKVLKGEL
jgi:hypothetical protein